MKKHQIDYSIGSRTLEIAVKKGELNKDNAQETIYIDINDLYRFLDVKFQEYGLYLEDRKDSTFYLTLSKIKTFGSYPSAAIHVQPLTFTGDRWVLQNRKSYSFKEYFHKDHLFPSQDYPIHHKICGDDGTFSTCSIKKMILSGPKYPNEYLQNF